MQTRTSGSLYDVEAQFGDVLRSERTRLKLSQKAFAEQLSAAGFSIDGPGLSRIESGARSLRLGEAKVISDVLGAPLEFFIGVNLKTEIKEARFRANRAMALAKSNLEFMASACLQIQGIIRDHPELLADFEDSMAGGLESADDYLAWVAARAAALSDDPDDNALTALNPAEYEGIRALLRGVADGVRINLADGSDEIDVPNPE